MATIVASRYAVLSVDDGDGDNDRLYSSKKKKKINKKEIGTASETSGQTKSNNSKKNKKPEKNQIQISNKAKKSAINTNHNKKKKQITSEDWEDRKEKDNQFDEGNFEEELSKAILLSKLDYEKKKNYYEQVKENQLYEANNDKSIGKKKKKTPKVMSLGEFNELNSKPNVEQTKKPVKCVKVEETPFFSQLDEDVKNEISKEHKVPSRKINDSFSQESLTVVLYEASIEKKDREISELRQEIENLKTQLKNVKTRNTKLCQIIANGEMKDKAEVLMEVERLQTIKDELSNEVASLDMQLQQERSKVRQLMKEQKSKDKSKKYCSSAIENQ